ncbi:MAG: hypothetical protein ACK56I_14595, partial [bacterium]
MDRYYKGMVEAEVVTRAAESTGAASKKSFVDKDRKKFSGAASYPKAMEKASGSGGHGDRSEARHKVSCYHCGGPHPVRLCDKAPQKVKEEFQKRFTRDKDKVKMVSEGDRPDGVIFIRDQWEPFRLDSGAWRSMINIDVARELIAKVETTTGPRPELILLEKPLLLGTA